MRAPRIVLLLFLAAQVLDGLFTYVAVSALGPAAEGNFVLATWMILAGPLPTLVVAKLVAAGAGAFIYWIGLHRVLFALTALYAMASIGPWLSVYRSWP